MASWGGVRCEWRLIDTFGWRLSGGLVGSSIRHGGVSINSIQRASSGSACVWFDLMEGRCGVF
jgi:hypothetical protein